MRYPTDDLRIRAIKELISPEELIGLYPLTDGISATVHTARRGICDILRGENDRLLVVVGPCSVHDSVAAREYAERLRPLIAQLHDSLLIVMRVYFEKPRTTVGWKGLINDPSLDGRFEINDGLKLARSLLVDINGMGVPAGTEFLDLISPQYVADLISWGAIGARTTESQGHRELASGLSCPVGFKNGTGGNLRIALDAMHAAAHPHHFLSVTKGGHSAIFTTAGNADTHMILRGGTRPNYDTESVNMAAEEMDKAGLTPRIMIDFSHANSRKRPQRQIDIGRDVAGQIARGDRRITGVMIESNLAGGRQDWRPDAELTYGQSITDACVGWEDTQPLLERLAEAVQQRREVV
jgi:3-deoxy-7-phosphoheptulonate synthase